MTQQINSLVSRLCQEAADEIERLHTELSELRAKTEAQAVPVAWGLVDFYHGAVITIHHTDWQAAEYRDKFRLFHLGVSPLYTAPPAQAVSVPDVDWLSNVIRAADGNNSLGAGALAEAIVSAMLSEQPK